MTRTSAPSWASRGTRLEPMNPNPPVTSATRPRYAAASGASWLDFTLTTVASA